MRFKLPEIPAPQLIASLRGFNLLPAIIFMPTRRRCDESALEVAQKKQNPHAERFALRQKMFQEYAEENPEIRNHKHRNLVVRAGVASHHAGHIPAWKLLVEKMMSAGLLDAIFATSTVAAGVDFPARTVVIVNADTRGNDGWRSLQASELQQMTGRAGRRGKDNVGFVVLAPSNFQNPPRIATLLKSPPDALQSKFRATYSSLLNLLDAYKSFSQVREIAEKSFAFRETAGQISRLERKSAQRDEAIKKRISASGFDLSVEDVRGFERLTATRNRLIEKPSTTRAEIRYKWLEENVQAGRIITQGRSGKQFLLVLNVFGDKVNAMKEDGSGTSFSLSRVNRVYAKKYSFNNNSVEEAFYEIDEGKNPALEEPRLTELKSESDDAVQLINEAIERIMPTNLSEDGKRLIQQFLWENWNDAEFIERTERDIETLRNEIWLPFEHRAKVLNHFGYLNFAEEKVTEAGKWLADLRVDRPLLVGEALRRGIFEKLEPKHAAALMGALAADADRNFGELHLSDKILDILTEFEDIVFEISGVEWKFGVEPAPEMNLSAAATAEAWADGANWESLVNQTKAEEGDLVRLLSRTGEALLQIAHLHDSNAESAEIARTAAEIVLRQPVR